jgi:hypothetical protein
MKKNKLQQRLRQLASKAKVSDAALEDAIGGYGPGGFFDCHCRFGPKPAFVGSWQRFYMNSYEIYVDISRRCSGEQGTCIPYY